MLFGVLLITSILCACGALTNPSQLNAMRLLVTTTISAVESLDVNPEDNWLAPEDAADAVAAAISKLQPPISISLGSPGVIQQIEAADLTDFPPLPPQGEYCFPPGVPFQTRFEQVERAAWDGDARAQHTVGLLIYNGVGGATKDARASAFWHTAAAAQGNLDGLAVLGGCVRNGVGASKDEETGLVLIKAAAAVMNPSGLNKLGVLYEEGGLPGGQPPDVLRAAELFALSADQGSALGLFYHGFALTHGIGTQRDIPAGTAAWQKSAALAPEDGAEEAAFCLWKHAEETEGRIKDEPRPNHWLKLAAALGHQDALEELAERKIAAIYSESPKKERFIRDDKARR